MNTQPERIGADSLQLLTLAVIVIILFSRDTYGILLDTGYDSGQHMLGEGQITIH